MENTFVNLSLPLPFTKTSQLTNYMEQKFFNRIHILLRHLPIEQNTSFTGAF